MTLSYMQEMEIRDANGNCRCPYCGKYRRREDFPEQDPHVYFENENVKGHIHVDPACYACLEIEET